MSFLLINFLCLTYWHQSYGKTKRKPARAGYCDHSMSWLLHQLAARGQGLVVLVPLVSEGRAALLPPTLVAALANLVGQCDDPHGSEAHLENIDHKPNQ
jgi:hypothetical protein